MNATPDSFPDLEAIRFFATQYPEVDPPAVMAYIAVMRFCIKASQSMGAYFQKLDLSHSGFMVMMMLLKDTNGDVTPAELADRLSLSRASISSLLDTLESKQWVCRHQDKADRRSCVLRLTTEGRAKLDAILPGHYRRIAQMMAGISPAERTTLMKVCQSLNQKIEIFCDFDPHATSKETT